MSAHAIAALRDTHILNLRHPMSNSQPNDGSDGFNLEFDFYLSGLIGDRFAPRAS